MVDVEKILREKKAELGKQIATLELKERKIDILLNKIENYRLLGGHEIDFEKEVIEILKAAGKPLSKLQIAHVIEEKYSSDHFVTMSRVSSVLLKGNKTLIKRVKTGNAYPYALK